ncbi:fungal-specific transcription factor domain-containing protein [Annulohypoxylon truncatum]|uniref:fungal-specific transcription factor domain-containing protein n=1 Tax=Annulohypoxylon truncatum TaxID=327061 RepID=UPI002008C447|nr:fungal-specific transcription factor domain-containing protein [Annulohypoxylon truncatum]KAI1212069.1 fungal-specific transcription factor domain-containing protein [Annulohypoxylon truncatum]
MGAASVSGRRHVTTACNPCRDDKIKCDGKSPSCSQCTDKKRQCAYNTRTDRRKISLRKSIETFSRRLRQLEAVLVSHGIGLPQIPNEDDASMIDSLMDMYAPTPEPLTPPSPIAVVSSESPDQAMPMPPPDPEPCIVANPCMDATEQPSIPGSTLFQFNSAIDEDWVWNVGAYSSYPALDLGGFTPITPMGSDTVIERAAAHPTISHGTLSPTLINDEDSSDDDDCPEVTSQFSSRLGTLLSTDTGERRFYGATSNMHFMQGRRAMKHSLASQAREPQIQAKLENAGVGQKVPVELTRHLTDLYFTWQNPSLYVVDRREFEKARDAYVLYKRENTFYSEVLVNALCAVGAAFNNNRYPGLPFSLSEFFAKRTRALIDMELDTPRIATIQGLAVLSIHEASATRDTRGWLLSGMAIRLAFDLGLHLNTKQYVQDGTMTAEEARARSVTFWGLIATDRMWGIYLGRPFHNTLETVSVEMPTYPQLGHKATLWTAYGAYSDHSKGLILPDPSHVLSEKWQALYEIMSPLELSLYFKADITNKVELVTFSQHTYERLLAWKAELPRELAIDMDNLETTSYLPHVLMLHMQYALFIITLHRPWVAKNYIQPTPLFGSGPRHAREMCLRSAVDIANLIRAFDRQYSLQRANMLLVHIAFTAALILLYATVSEKDFDCQRELSTQLDMCCQALAELGNSFENAARTLDILLSVKRMWQASLVSGMQTKRPQPREWFPINPSSKRLRISEHCV